MTFTSRKCNTFQEAHSDSDPGEGTSSGIRRTGELNALSSGSWRYRGIDDDDASSFSSDFDDYIQPQFEPGPPISYAPSTFRVCSCEKFQSFQNVNYLRMSIIPANVFTLN